MSVADDCTGDRGAEVSERWLIDSSTPIAPRATGSRSALDLHPGCRRIRERIVGHMTVDRYHEAAFVV